MKADERELIRKAITSYMHKSEIYPTPRCIRVFVDIIEKERDKHAAVCAELEELQKKYDDLQEHNMQLQSIEAWTNKAKADAVREAVESLGTHWFSDIGEEVIRIDMLENYADKLEQGE